MAVSLAVIIAAAAAGGIVVVAIAIRIIYVIHQRRAHPPAPLPPARPLAMLQETPWAAHHRQQHLDSSTPSLQISLRTHGQYMAERQKRRVYAQPRAAGTEEALLRQPLSPMSSPSASASEHHSGALTPPQPMFLQSDGPAVTGDSSSSHLSLNSGTDESEMGAYPPQRHQSHTALPHSVLTDPSITEESASANGSNPPSPMLTSSKRARPLSVTASSVRTANTGSRSNAAPSMRSTRSTLRGAPHRPHSRVDIVLPTPLAATTPERRPRSHYDADGGLNGSRTSVCDAWLNVGRAGTTHPSQGSAVAKASTQRPRRNSENQISSAAHRPKSQTSISSTSSRIASTEAPLSSFSASSRSSTFTAPSVQSQQSSSLRRKLSVDLTQVPPVPRVPSMYSNSASRSGSAAPSPVSVSAPKQLPSGDDAMDESVISASFQGQAVAL